MKKLLLSLCLLIALYGYSQTIQATQIELNSYGDSNPKNFAKGDTKMYFFVYDFPQEGLWVYDLTTHSTHSVFNNNNFGHSVFMTIGDILYFTIDSGTELWRSDGTEAGTYLLKHINTDNWSSNSIKEMINYNGKIIFAANDDSNGLELWQSDGTPDGTTLLKDIRTGAYGSEPNNFFVFNGNLFFLANDGISGQELWKSDGTPSGTALFKNIDAADGNSIAGGKFITMNNAFYFYASNITNGYELWKSDGTATGTQMLKDINPGNGNSFPILVGAKASNYFVFEVNTTATGIELWKSDGTAAGTVLLKDIYPGSYSGMGYNTQFAVLDNTIYFNAYTSANGFELWGTDGTTLGTQLIKDIYSGAEDSNIKALTAANGFLIFSAQDGTRTYNTVWKSNGTLTGTSELFDTNLTVESTGEMSFTAFDNKIFFPAGYNSLNGIELWSTDGTVANTKIFKDLSHRYGGVAGERDPTPFNGKIIFPGNNGNGYTVPFISDGTISGSKIVRDPQNGGPSSLFSTTDGWNSSFCTVGNLAFFRAGNATNGYEIWRTDGTAANTVMVKDIAPGTTDGIDEYTLFFQNNNIFYFRANDQVHGLELWRSDGTEAGTFMLKDIYPGDGHGLDGQSNIHQDHPFIDNDHLYAIVNGLLYFTANDGTGMSIWRTDGTQNGTIKVITVPGNPYGLDIIQAANNRIFFETHNSNLDNSQLWSSDGTQAGTINLSAVLPSTYCQFKKNLVVDNAIYFAISSNPSLILMKSDGTLAGTMIVKDNFTTYRDFNSLYACGNYVYFTVGQHGISGKELWRTNGTTAGTVKLEEFDISENSYFIDCNTCVQNNLFFLKDYLDTNIWYINDTLTVSASLDVTILNSENFTGYEGITNLIQLGDNLMFEGIKSDSGRELFYAGPVAQLGIPEIPVENQQTALIKLYPNPTNGFLTVATNDNADILRIELFDLLGKKIKDIAVATNTPQFSLQYLEKGIYLVRVKTASTVETKKIILR
jgi:ELWxxDGT repeat protein